jgi:amino acid transporter
MPYAMFAFGGARVIPDFAEEVKRRKYIVYALILTVVGEGLLYLLYDYAFITGLNWSVLGVKSGDWAGLKIAGNPFITLSSNYHAEVALGILLFAGIVGPFLTGYVYMGSGSRVLFATARSGLVSSKFGEVHEKYSIPYWALLAFGVAGAVVTFLFAPVPSIYGLINDATVAGYIGFATNPVAMMVLRRQGVSKYRLKGGSVIAPIAFAVASLIVFWNGWPAVPYSVLLMGIASVIFGVLFKAREGLVDSIWYIVYIGFLTAMVYVGSDGALNIIPYYWATAIVAVVSVALFYPIGILSGLRQRNYEVHEADVPKQKQ